MQSPTIHKERIMKSLYVALVALCGCAASLQAQSGFQVVVNESNSVDRINAGDLARIYLREQNTWPNGKPVVPVDLPAESSARERFTSTVLGKSTSQIKAHWEREVFAGRAVPPAEQRSEREVLSFVAANPGSVGYVSESATLPNGVRALAIGGGAASNNTVYTAGQVEKAPQLISRPYVTYPSKLLNRGTEGQVILQFVVNDRGRVEDSTISVVQSSARDFEAPAIEAVRRSAFKPGRVSGRAVHVQVRQTINFALSDRG
jgi:TonB family protein